MRTPDRNGKLDDVVLGCDSVEKYVAQTAHFGGIIGRYANRIAHGSFQLDGQTYSIPKNDGDNALHGGIRGFDKVVWGCLLYTSSGDAVGGVHEPRYVVAGDSSGQGERGDDRR